MRLLLDEMYSARLAEALRAVDVDTATVVELGLAGRSDLDVFAAGVEQDRVVLTENAADFRPISAEHLNTGQHHRGILIAVSSRFSRRPAGIGMLVSAIRAVADQQLEDRVLYLELPEQP